MECLGLGLLFEQSRKIVEIDNNLKEGNEFLLLSKKKVKQNFKSISKILLYNKKYLISISK